MGRGVAIRFCRFFSVIDWNVSATEVQHGKAMIKEDEEMKVQTMPAENLESLTQEDSKRALLKPSLILTCSVIGLLARTCVLDSAFPWCRN